MSAFLIVLGILALVAILVTKFPDATEAWFMRIVKVRRIAIAVGGIILALVLLSSGVFFLQFLGGIILLYAILTVIFDPTLEGVRKPLQAIPYVGRVFE